MVKNYLDEIKISEEFFNVAEENAEESIRTSANRIYFALEKAVTAYLYFRKIKVPKNNQKIWELSAKLLGEEYYTLLRNLYDLRMQADYGNTSIFVDLNNKVIKDNLTKVRNLINKIKEKLKNG